MREHALLNIAHLVRDEGGFAAVVRYVNGGDAELLLNALQFQAQGVPGWFVNGAYGFIEQQHGRADYQRPRQGRFLLFPAAEVPDVPVKQRRDMQQLRHALHLLPPFLDGKMADPQSKLDVLGHGVIREEKTILRDVSYVSLPGREIGDSAAFYPQFAAQRAEQSGEKFYQEGFSRTVGAGQYEIGAMGNIERYVLQRKLSDAEIQLGYGNSRRFHHRYPFPPNRLKIVSITTEMTIMPAPMTSATSRRPMLVSRKMVVGMISV